MRGRSSSATACCGPSAKSPPTATSSVLGRALPRRRAPSRRPGGCACSPSSPAPLGRPTPRSPPTRLRAASGSATSPMRRSGPDESARDALERRLAETAEKEVWNGTTLVGPHRDDSPSRSTAATSRPSPRGASSARRSSPSSSPSSTCSPRCDGRPPLLLLDDVFSELDPDRRSHLVRRIAALPQAFVTTTTLDDLDPALLDDCGHLARCDPEDGATLEGPDPDGRPRERRRTRTRPPPRRPMSRIGDLIPSAAARLGLADELRRGPHRRDVRRDRRGAGPGGARRVPGAPDRGRGAGRRGRRADRRPGAPAPRRAICVDAFRSARRGRPGRASCASRFVAHATVTGQTDGPTLACDNPAPATRPRPWQRLAWPPGSR